MEWMLMPLRRYADFSGRSRRKEYWMFVLLLLIVGVVLGLVTGGFSSVMDPTSMGGDATMGAGSMILGLFYLAIFIPALAVQVRRFHDQDKSGWFVLLNFIPLVGGLIVFIFMCLDGTRGDNRFGPDPKMADHIGETFS
jgi:uncharacterized membrane protein YhaH (DUF805 family)